MDDPHGSGVDVRPGSGAFQVISLGRPTPSGRAGAAIGTGVQTRSRINLVPAAEARQRR